MTIRRDDTGIGAGWLCEAQNTLCHVTTRRVDVLVPRDDSRSHYLLLSSHHPDFVSYTSFTLLIELPSRRIRGCGTLRHPTVDRNIFQNGYGTSPKRYTSNPLVSGQLGHQAASGLLHMTDYDTGENWELRQQLNSEYRDKRADAIKRVIANHTIGKDCSGLFPDVVKNMVCHLLRS